MDRGTALREVAAWRNGEGIYVSIQRAKLLMSGLRWHHLGFSFFWATTFAALTSSSEELLGGYESYSFCKQIVVVLVLAIAAYVLRARDSYTQRHAIMAGVFLATGSLLFYLAFLRRVFARGRLGGRRSGRLFFRRLFRDVAEFLCFRGRISHGNLHSAFGSMFRCFVPCCLRSSRHLVGGVFRHRPSRIGNLLPVSQSRRNRAL